MQLEVRREICIYTDVYIVHALHIYRVAYGTYTLYRAGHWHIYTITHRGVQNTLFSMYSMHSSQWKRNVAIVSGKQPT